MSKKNEVQKKTEGGVPAYLSDHRDEAKENLENIDDAYYRIAINQKCKFMIEGEPIGDRGELFSAIILRDTPVNVYYSVAFDPSNPVLPDCWSLGGLKPDPGSENPQHTSCATCPMNKFGTGVGQDGKPSKGKACSNTRRLVLRAPGMDMPALISLPPTSRRNLDQYLKRLASQGIPLYAVSTEFSFDNSVDYPKVSFDQGEFLSEEEFNNVKEQRHSPEIDKVVNAFSAGSEVEEEPEEEPPF
jgi:hypothetical protein